MLESIFDHTKFSKLIYINGLNNITWVHYLNSFPALEDNHHSQLAVVI